MYVDAVNFSHLHWVTSHNLGILMPLSLEPQSQYNEDVC